jgi:hypothetical protein
MFYLPVLSTKSPFSQLEASLRKISQSFALQFANQLASSSNLTLLLSISPQTVITPIWYTINNLVPFNVPVYVFFHRPCHGYFNRFYAPSAYAVTFVGLIYQLILSFFIVVRLTPSPTLNLHLRDPFTTDDRIFCTRCLES